jgi:hypothetical protein
MMDKQYFFLNSLPRAGNTLLGSILNQNPDMQVTANSIVPEFLQKIHNSKFEVFFKCYPDHRSLDNVLKNIIPNYYKDWNYKYIIDRCNVGIGNTLMLLKQYLKTPLKIIVLERALDEVLSSFLRVHKNWNLPIENQIEWFLQPDFAFMKGVNSIRNLSRPECKDITHFITYNDLVNNPKETIKGIYEFLEVPQYNHYFNDLEKFTANGIAYREDWYLPSRVEVKMHDVRTEDISFIKHNKLSKDIIQMVQQKFGIVL